MPLEPVIFRAIVEFPYLRNDKSQCRVRGLQYKLEPQICSDLSSGPLRRVSPTASEAPSDLVRHLSAWSHPMSGLQGVQC